MPLPLSHVRVLDLCTVFAGPFTAMLMADQGADVIKVEAPDGDTSRGVASGSSIESTDLSISFLAFNRNKRSVTLDITTQAGKEAAYRLCQWADVLIINTRVDGRKRRGFSYEDIAAINPRLVYVSLTGYGDDGPEANLPGIDIVIQARAGDMASRGEPGQPPPRQTPLYHFDMATSMAAAYAILVALIERDRTGVGQKIETSLLQTALSLHSVQMARIQGRPERTAVRSTGFRNGYQCADGRYILNFAMNLNRSWDNIVETFQLEELRDPRFATAEDRLAHADEIEQIVARNYLTKTASEWEAIFKAAGHTANIVRDLDEVFDDPQVIANEMVTYFDQPQLGTVEAVGRPFRLSASAALPWHRHPAPSLGEHTDEVLLDVGYSEAEIAAMHLSGALGRVQTPAAHGDSR